ncbi:MAG: type II secretion system protein GspD [Armatimonadota bacterium]
MKAQVTAPVSRWYRLILITALLAVTMMGFAAPAARNIRELNFSDAEISVVLKALADLGGTNIVVGPGVKGPITVSLKNVTVDEALDIITFQCGLAYAVVNNTYIVNTPQMIIPILKEGDSDTGNSVVELKYLAPAEATKALSVAFRDLQVTGVGTNLVLVGNTGRLEDAKAFLASIDKQGIEDSSAVVTLQYTTIENATAALALVYKDVIISQLPHEKQRIVLSGDKKRVDAAKAFLAQLDTALPQQTITEPASEKSYQVKNVIPWQAKEYLESLFGSRGLKVSYAPKILDAALEAQPAAQPAPAALVGPEGAKTTTAAKVDWSSRTLVLRGPISVVDEAIASVAKVDVAVKSAELRCSVKRIFATHAIAYLLERYEARGLTIYSAPMNYQEILADKEATEAGAKLTRGGGGGQIGALVRRNEAGQLNVAEPIGDFILRGTPELVDEAAKTLATIDIGPERVVEVVKLNYLKAADVKKQLDELYNKQGLQVSLAPSLAVQPFGTALGTMTGDTSSSASSSASDKGKTDVIADLVLRGSEEVVASAIQLVQQMDIEPQLVSIKAQIISMDADAEKILGIQWPGSIGTTLTEQPSGDPLRFGTIIRDPISLKVTLNALETQHKLKVISRPASVVRNGNVSFIHVGKTVTFERFVGLDSAGNKVFSQETLDTGVSMQLRPLVSPDGVITVDIMAGITSDPAFRVSASGSDLPTVTTTTTTTTVQVRDGETLVIGGLTQEKQEERRSGVPVLSKIPLIGGLFRNKTTTPAQTDLVIMITPTILRPGSPEAVTAPVVQ